MATEQQTTAEEQAVLDLLHATSYAHVEAQTGWSKGKIWRLAAKHSARKTERRIRERAQDRLARQRETLQDILNETVTSDVLDFLDGLPDEGVQTFITSIPYNVAKPYGAEAAPAPSADRMRHLYFHGWLQCIISEMARILKPGGVIFLQVGTTKDDDGERIPLDVLLFDDLKRAGLQFQNRVMWPAAHGLTPKRRLAERHETALVFSKGEPVFNPNAARIPQLEPGKRAFRGPNKGKLSGHPLGAWPTDIFAINHIGANHHEKRDHPAQFPIELARRAVLLYSAPGDLCADPFSGTGAVHAACVATHRAFVGADLFYQDVRKTVLENAFPDTYTPLTGVTNDSMAIWSAEARRVESGAEPISDEEDAAQVMTLFDQPNEAA